MRTDIDEKLSRGRRSFDLPGWNCLNSDNDGLDGIFIVQGPCGAELRIISSTADPHPDDPSQGWEHVSVSLSNRCPNWPEMCFVKSLFWRGDEAVVQFHPPESDYVNNHPYCLHMWRDTLHEQRLPPSILVGIAGLELTP